MKQSPEAKPGCLQLPSKQRASSRRSIQQLMYLHFSKYSSAISRHGNHRNRNYSGQAVAESLRHGTRSNSQYMFTEVAALFQKRASLLGNEKRQIDATFGTSDSSQSHERTRPRHHPTALPITKMASGVLPFRSHGEKAATSSD